MADTMMTFKNNDLATNFMTMDELKKACPVAFMTEPTNPNVSNKYIQANTATVIEDLVNVDVMLGNSTPMWDIKQK